MPWLRTQLKRAGGAWRGALWRIRHRSHPKRPRRAARPRRFKDKFLQKGAFRARMCR